jgi:hypothetical protein
MKLPKKPKKPREGASLTTWENYTSRVSDWKKKVAKVHADKKKKKNLIEKSRRA